MMNNPIAEPTINCPQCGAVIKLTDSLAAPMIEAVKRDYEARLSEKNAEVIAREKSLKDREQELQRQKESIDEQVASRLDLEREKIGLEEAKKARVLLSTDIDQKSKEIAELQAVITERDRKLGEAQKAQAELIRKLWVLSLRIMYSFFPWRTITILLITHANIRGVMPSKGRESG